MSLIQGYSSSEEDEVEPAVNANAKAVAFSALPAPQAKGRLKQHPLPLLDESIHELDESDDSSAEEEATPVARQDDHIGMALVDNGGVQSYSYRLAVETNVAKRPRIVDEYDDDDLKVSSGDIIGHHKELSSQYTTTAAEKPSMDVFQRTESLQKQHHEASALKDELARNLSDELRSANKAGSQFVQLDAREVRAEARRYQQEGVTANLQRHKGVSGRNNQITSLARAAARMREDS